VSSVFGYLRDDLLPLAERPARAARVFEAVYREQVTRLADLRGIPPPIRTRLADALDTGLPAIHSRFDSADGTRRYLLRLADGQLVESVVIPSGGRDTFCISSQIGCALACTFCLTGRMGLVRDLSTAEIVSQVMVLLRDSDIPSRRRFSLVFMGMGEPLQNYDNVIRAIRILADGHGLALPAARITLSTAGLVPGVERLGAEPVFPNLSVSLTGVTNEVRNRLMPVNRRYPVEQVLAAIRALPRARQRRVMIECVMIRGVTDSLEDARTLAELLRGIPAKVNLIPLNPDRELPFEPAGRDAILRYQEVLLKHGTATFIRRTRGDDISGACGQLSRRVVHTEPQDPVLQPPSAENV
jgi:23S rRNA (adenine2503-C2)-methyltransferase